MMSKLSGVRSNLKNAVAIVQNNLTCIDESKLSELDRLGLKAARECFADIITIMREPTYHISWETDQPGDNPLDSCALHGPIRSHSEALVRLESFRAQGFKSTIIEMRFLK